MTPDLVADVGNTRLKWGWRTPTGERRMVALPPDEPAAWAAQLAEMKLPAPRLWAVAGVHPPRQERFLNWVAAQGDATRVIDRHDIPLTLDVLEPEQMGLDRLLNALAALRHARPHPAIVISVGTATVVDLIEPDGTYRGGVILPGPQMMADALHAYTALLPRFAVDSLAAPPAPGRTTEGCIRTGIRAAILGAADRLIAEYSALAGPAVVFVTGGGAGAEDFTFPGAVATYTAPTLTLDGLWLAAEGLP